MYIYIIIIIIIIIIIQKSIENMKTFIVLVISVGIPHLQDLLHGTSDGGDQGRWALGTPGSGLKNVIIKKNSGLKLI